MSIPTKATLKKYGFGSNGTTPEEDWLSVLAAQGGVCPICGKVPSTGRWVTDHEHVRGWKDMEPNERRKYVRGITCWWDNSTFLGRSLTLVKAMNVVKYLEDYIERRKQNESK